MVITRPKSTPQQFEGIANCFVGRIDGNQLYPPSDALSQSNYPPVELIYESDLKSSDNHSIEVSTDSLRRAVDEGANQYIENVGTPGIEKRFQEYLTEEIGLSVADAIELFRDEGFAPFLLLKRIFVSEPLSAICLDFACFGEEYLDEHGFSLDWTGERVEFVTPRGLMQEGSYPASRKD